jgi:hypothetical protein
MLSIRRVSIVLVVVAGTIWAVSSLRSSTPHQAAGDAASETSQPVSGLLVNGDQAGLAHPTEGPHGGHLIELGNEEYHAELLHDENTHAVTIHLLDGPGKQPLAIPQTEIALQLFQDGKFVKYALKAIQGPGDAAGAASRFEIVDATLCDALGHEDETRGRLQVTIDGKPYTGTIEHSSHGDHEGHEH